MVKNHCDNFNKFFSHHQHHNHHGGHRHDFWHLPDILLKKKGSLSFCLLGVMSIFWFCLRSLKKPSRMQYPCQKIAAANSLVFLVWLAGIMGILDLYRKLKKNSQLFIKLSVSGFLCLVVFWGIKKYEVWQRKTGYLKVTRAQITASRVVQITNSSAASSTNRSTINQSTVNSMMDQAIMALTSQISVGAAWNSLFQRNNSKRGKGSVGYVAGEKIAIKVNFNNDCCENEHNADYQTVNAITRQLVQDVGIAASNIYIYDASRTFPTYFQNGLLYGVQQAAQNTNNYYSQNWSDVSVGGTYLAKLVVDTTYIINVPLLRGHAIAGVSLSFKNHYGSIKSVPDSFHNFDGSSTFGQLVNLNKNTNIKDKTVLVVGDGILAITNWNIGPHSAPSAIPKTLFVSYDPVAADTVMVSYLRNLSDNAAPDWADGYLIQAEAQGLGSHSNIEKVICNQNCSFVPTLTPVATLTRTPTPTLTVTLTNTITPAPCIPKDVNCDGLVNVSDMKLILGNYRVKNYSPLTVEINKDGVVNTFDYVLTIH